MSAIYVNLVGQPGRAAPPPKDGRKWSNRKHKSRNDFPVDEGTAPLSKKQKAGICAMATRAFARVHGRRPANSAELEEWRRGEQRAATGHASLTTCTQAHYNGLLARFAHLAGEDGVAMKRHVRDATSAQRVAMHKLCEACEERGLALSWPASICRSKFKCGLDEANSKQLWKLVFDVRNSKHPVLKKPATKEGPAAGNIDIPF